MSMSRAVTSFALALAVAGCATPAPPELHTRYLAEVIATAPSDAAAGGGEHEGTFEPFPDALWRHCAVARQGPEVTTLALLRFSYYWHNGGAPVRQTVRWYPVARGLEVSPGMMVSAELQAGAAGADSRCPWVTEILGPDADTLRCSYVNAETGIVKNALYMASLIGPPGSASLDCPDLESAGWEKRPFGLYGGTVLTRSP